MMQHLIHYEASLSLRCTQRVKLKKRKFQERGDRRSKGRMQDVSFLYTPIRYKEHYVQQCRSLHQGTEGLF